MTGGSSGTVAGGSGGGLDARPDCTSSGCPPGDYCNTATLVCTACADLSRLEFSPPEKIAAVSATVEGNQRFPRLTHNANEMLFQTGAYNTLKQFWVTSDYTVAGLHAVLALSAGNQALGGPLEATVSFGTGQANFFFDRTVSGLNSNRELVSALRSGTSVTNVARMQVPFNDATTTVSSNYSIAVAPVPGRMWWMTNRSGSPALVTALPGGTLTTLNVTLGESGCARLGGDATPWVSADGSLLLFRAIEQDDLCITGPDAHDLYAVLLGPTGVPLEPARRLNVSTTGWDDTDPTLSSDLCWIYFSSDEAPDNEYDVFRAQRN